MPNNELSVGGALQSPILAMAATGTKGQEAGNGAKPSSQMPVKEQNSDSVDTVTLMNKVQDNRHAGQKEEAQKSGESGRTMNDILFAYNYRGDLRIKFMDSVNKLVYQVPPVLVAKMSDLMAQPDSAVNTKA